MEQDQHGFVVPKLPMQRNNSPSPPPPAVLTKPTKKRKRVESMDSTLDNYSKKQKVSHSSSASIYASPSWAQLPPKHYKFELEVIKNGVSLNKIALNTKSHFIFGRDPSVDILTLHPSCSRFHAVLQHRKNGEWLLFDFGSTHFTKLNHKKLHPHKYYKINIGSIIQFGSSRRMYILNGPKELQTHSNDDREVSETKPQTNGDNTMQSMLKQLATQSQHNATPTAHRKHTLKANVWGLEDAYDPDTLHTTTFDEQQAKQNPQTKELFAELQLKRKQHHKAQNQLKESQSKQRSDKPLTQTQCIKIEKLRSKVDRLEDETDAISTKISNRLRGIQSTDDGHSTNNYYENDPFDDDDDYYDRIKKVIPRKHHEDIHHSHALNRSARYLEDQQPQVRDYDSYKDELEHLEMKASEIEQTLRDIEYRKRINTTDKEKTGHNEDTEAMDEIVNDLKANDHKYKTLKRELEELDKRKQLALRMVNMLRPAYFKIMDKEPERVNRERKVSTYSPKKNTGEEVIKPGSLADIAQKMKTEAQKQKEHEEEIEKEAKQRLLEREKEIKEAEQARVDAMKKFEDEQKKTEEKRKWLRLKDEENASKVGLIVYNKNGSNNEDERKRSTLETEFAKLTGNKVVIDDTRVDVADEMAFIREADGEFVAPANQTGDGKTWLNDKYGY
eukprot:475651_1